MSASLTFTLVTITIVSSIIYLTLDKKGLDFSYLLTVAAHILTGQFETHLLVYKAQNME